MPSALNRGISIAVLMLAMTLVASDSATARSGASSRDFPLRGLVSSSSTEGLAVRESPPAATRLTYKLGDRICGIGNGSQFIAFEQVFIANGEIWFQVLVTEVTKSLGGIGCPSTPFEGWMVAKLKTRWAVTILEEGLSLETSTGREMVEAVERPLEAEPAFWLNDISYAPLFDYLLLLLGSGAAVCVVAIKQAEKIHPKHWFTKLRAFEFLILGTVNVIFVGLLIDQLYEVAEPSFLFRLLEVLQTSEGGFMLLGFVLSVLLLRFMSFADKD